jgi:glycerophosphoryl diester phosphodiesterase
MLPRKYRVLWIGLGLVLIGTAFLGVMRCFGGEGTTGGQERKDFEIVAHRGVHVNWKKGTYDPVNGCEAQHIYKPTHDYIENTLRSIGAAFDYGATIVEIDIRRTRDNHLVVFHDDILDGRTNGHGTIGEHTLEYLKSLDIGYGYTYDDGKTFPFRGQGKGMMLELTEVLKAFPKQKFLIDHKDGSMATAQILAGIIQSLPEAQQKLLYYWGPDETHAYLNHQTGITRLFATHSQLKQWMLRYIFSFGLYRFPAESKGLVFGAPPQYAKFFWGWPKGFLKNVHAAGAKFYLMVDSEKDALKCRNVPVDGIITDYIEVVGKYYYNTVENTNL